MNKAFDVIIVITPADYVRVRGNVTRIMEMIDADKFYFVGSEKVGEMVTADNYGDRVGFVDENSIIPFDDVHAVVKSILGRDDVPRGVTGWYYQQFLKMQHSYVTDKEYYMSWDGDTVPCKKFSMFDAVTGKPYFDVKTEYHEEYFVTLGAIFPGMHKVIGKSFISEHMLFDKTIMQKMIEDIMGRQALAGGSFYEKILRSVRPGKLVSNSFSEFETFGTYVALTRQDAYRIRQWHSIRYGSLYLKPDCMTDADYDWIGRDFDAVSFEKNQEYIPEIGKYFSDTSIRDRISARYIVETIQEYSTEGMKEEWD